MLALAAASAVFKLIAWKPVDDWSRFCFGSDGRTDELPICCMIAMLLSWTRWPAQAWFRVTVRVLPALVWPGYLLAESAIHWDLFYR